MTFWFSLCFLSASRWWSFDDHVIHVSGDGDRLTRSTRGIFFLTGWRGVGTRIVLDDLRHRIGATDDRLTKQYGHLRQHTTTDRRRARATGERADWRG